MKYAEANVNLIQSTMILKIITSENTRDMFFPDIKDWKYLHKWQIRDGHLKDVM